MEGSSQGSGKGGGHLTEGEGSGQCPGGGREAGQEEPRAFLRLDLQSRPVGGTLALPLSAGSCQNPSIFQKEEAAHSWAGGGTVGSEGAEQGHGQPAAEPSCYWA